MTYLHLGHCRETRIFSPAGAILRTSKNLRGMRDYDKGVIFEAIDKGEAE